MDWITAAGILAVLGFGVAVVAVVIGGNRDDRLTEDDFPVQNDFGVSMDRFGYVQDARNRGAE